MWMRPMMTKDEFYVLYENIEFQLTGVVSGFALLTANVGEGDVIGLYVDTNQKGNMETIFRVMVRYKLTDFIVSEAYISNDEYGNKNIYSEFS